MKVALTQSLKTSVVFGLAMEFFFFLGRVFSQIEKKDLEIKCNGIPLCFSLSDKVHYDSPM